MRHFSVITLTKISLFGSNSLQYDKQGIQGNQGIQSIKGVNSPFI